MLKRIAGAFAKPVQVAALRGHGSLPIDALCPVSPWCRRHSEGSAFFHRRLWRRTEQLLRQFPALAHQRPVAQSNASVLRFQASAWSTPSSAA